jgi:hypothetical protein
MLATTDQLVGAARGFLRRRRLVTASVIFAAAVLLALAPAGFAEHLHTVNGVGHGMGDTAGGESHNFKIHPYVGDKNRPQSLSFQLRFNRSAHSKSFKTVAHGRCRYCPHKHRTYDTSPDEECSSYGWFDATHINRNRHNHWNYSSYNDFRCY